MKQKRPYRYKRIPVTDLVEQSTKRWAKRELRKLTYMQYIIAFAIGLSLVYYTVDIKRACAQSSVPTTVTVTISAEVSCNPENCPELPEEEPAIVISVDNGLTWWQQVIQWIRKPWKGVAH